MSLQDSGLTPTKLTELSKSSKTVNLWSYFTEIVRIPRPSAGEKAIREYVLKIAKDKQLVTYEDGAGNILIEIPATQGYEIALGIIFQSHLDMVPVKVPESPIDPATQGVVLQLEGNEAWLKAKGTSLGADNGWGIAASLALLEEKIDHGPLALLFTVDEERGLKGANELDMSVLNQYRYLINLDSEKEGEAIVGCAGGGDTVISLPVEKESAAGRVFLKLKVSGLKGGHSGVDIDKGRANAIKILANVIDAITKKGVDLNFVSFNGGTARNVIPSEAEVVMAIEPKKKAHLQKIITEVELKFKKKYQNSEPSLTISPKIEENPFSEMMTLKTSRELNTLLLALPHGIIKWSEEVSGLVETSTNLATIKTAGNEVLITNMSRSAIDKSLKAARTQIKSVAEKAGAKVELAPSYPGWKPKPESSIVNLVKEVYKKTTGRSLMITAVHAGLECGIILKKYPHFEAISIGPTLTDVHSIREKMNIISAGRVFNLIKEIIKAVASQSF